ADFRVDRHFHSWYRVLLTIENGRASAVRDWPRLALRQPVDARRVAPVVRGRHRVAMARTLGGFAAWRRAGDSPYSRSAPVDSRDVGISDPNRLGLQRAMASDFSRVGKAAKPLTMDRGLSGVDFRGGGDAWRGLVVDGRFRFCRNRSRVGLARIHACAPARQDARRPYEFPRLREALLRLADRRSRPFHLGGSRGIRSWHLGSFAPRADGRLSRGDGIRDRTTNSAGILRRPRPFQPGADVRIAIVAEY